ncbi:MAG TPA: hypothetical protein VFU28_12255 [Vicinamibacterales bacterium]|nr:hypothetical protein [Vicinamibacterales bacterium]
MFDRKVSKGVSRAVAYALGIATVAIFCAGTPSAQTLSKKTTVTFNVPVEIPGASAQVLPAGVYVFRLLDSLSDRNIVQVFNKDESHIYATILAISNFRLRATDKTVITFAERAAGEPQAIKAWFYPGDNWGQEFVYPKSRALELAKRTNLPVLYIPDEVAPSIVAPVKTADDAPVVALKEAPLKAVSPAGQDVALADVVASPPKVVAGLPKTASNVPFIFVIGLFFMTAAVALNTLGRRA